MEHDIGVRGMPTYVNHHCSIFAWALGLQLGVRSVFQNMVLVSCMVLLPVFCNDNRSFLTASLVVDVSHSRCIHPTFCPGLYVRIQYFMIKAGIFWLPNILGDLGSIKRLWRHSFSMYHTPVYVHCLLFFTSQSLNHKPTISRCATTFALCKNFVLSFYCAGWPRSSQHYCHQQQTPSSASPTHLSWYFA